MIRRLVGDRVDALGHKDHKDHKEEVDDAFDLASLGRGLPWHIFEPHPHAHFLRV